MKKLVARSYVESIDKDNEGVLEVAVASDSIVDRHGEIVSQEGWELKNFKKNPQLLWGHNSNELPIGKVKKIWFEGEGKKKKLMFKPQFDMEDDFARKVYRKFKDGFLNAFSVGFMPLEQDGNTYTKAELLEISAVAVPANPNALAVLRDAGMKAVTWKDMSNEEENEENTEVAEVSEEEAPEAKPTEVSEEEVVEDPTEELEALREENKALQGKVDVYEAKEAKEIAGLKQLHDMLRILNQATAIALKKVKESNKINLKGGEN